MGGIKYSEFQKKYDTGILRELKLKPGEYIVFVGRASEHKGVHYVAEACQKAGYPLKFVAAVGEPVGDYKQRLEKLRDASSGKFVLSSIVLPRDKLDELYQKSAFYVTGSVWEGLNLPLVEAQACGKPVIAFDLCAHPEVVRNNKTGFLVPPGDTTAFARAITSLANDKKLRDKMGKNARVWAREFDWPAIAKNVEREIQRIA